MYFLLWYVKYDFSFQTGFRKPEIVDGNIILNAVSMVGKLYQQTTQRGLNFHAVIYPQKAALQFYRAISSLR